MPHLSNGARNMKYHCDKVYDAAGARSRSGILQPSLPLYGNAVPRDLVKPEVPIGYGAFGVVW